jgi:uncharacterized lipoprotein YddW (UPF0748 family)
MKTLAAAILILASARGEDVRAIWVTRYDYRTEEDIRAIVANCASLGFNTVLFQVRGQADAYYRSRIEPWAERLGGRDPGFDPLDVACREAHRRGVALHAWVNVMPAWKGKTAPAAARHVWNEHPEWIVAGKDGKRQRLNDHYVCVNPCLPAVREHLTAVARDIVTRYPVDGLHLDYIRFIEGDWSYDRETLRLFGGSPARDPEGWAAFRRDAVTEVVRSIRKAARQAAPDVVLSAAVFPTARGRRERSQDAEAWAREGIVDWVVPMTYEDGEADFGALVDDAFKAFRGTRVLPGVGAYKHDTADQTVRQVRLAGGSFSLFAYSSLFASADDSQADQERLRRARREALKRALSEAMGRRP